MNENRSSYFQFEAPLTDEQGRDSHAAIDSGGAARGNGDGGDGGDGGGGDVALRGDGGGGRVAIGGDDGDDYGAIDSDSDGGDSHAAIDGDDNAPFDDDRAAETLSPAVRRLIKQYGIDIAGIRGSGPGGRVRAGDVMAALGNRATPEASGERPAEALAPRAEAVTRARTSVGSLFEEEGRERAPLATTVFECDLAAIIDHRQRRRAEGIEIVLICYFLVAAAAAMRRVPEVNGGDSTVNLSLQRTAVGRREAKIWNAEGMSIETMNAALANVDDALSTPPSAGATTFAAYDHGASGSVLAVPAPVDSSHAASLGIGRARRQVVLRQVDGETVSRASAVCFLSLTYDPRQVTLERANRWLAEVVQTLERWGKADGGA